MMERTDRHHRAMMRMISRHTLLYTEMVTTWGLLRGGVERHLDYSEMEHPIALQLGGNDPEQLAECARLAEQWGYDEVNLNVGCPSPRVSRGAFGASLMTQPELVAECVSAMREACSMPVTVKHRTGVDNNDSWEELVAFIEIVERSGADRFSVHARKAWLNGLSPKENRNIPPLQYDWVHRLKSTFPHQHIEINGHIKSLDESLVQLEVVDAVMIGRAAWDNPYLFAHADQRVFGDDRPVTSREEVVRGMAEYAEERLSTCQRTTIGHIAKPMLNLFNGVPGAREWRRRLSTEAFRKGAGPQLLIDAMP